ncbi:MAG: hypothetical protein ACTHKL_05710 [Streptosporangiaceae bacterium]
MNDEAEAIRLLHRADWTQLRLSAQVNDGSTVVVAPGKRYRLETAGYITGCDGARPWQLSDEVLDEDVEQHLIGGPEPPLRDLLCPAWLLAGSRLEVRGRTRACGRDALEVVVTSRPSLYERGVSAWWNLPAKAIVDTELGILLRVVRPGRSHEPQSTELVAADFDPPADPEQFKPPPGSLRAESFGEALGWSPGGGLGWRAAKTAAGMAAGGLGAWIRHGPKPDHAPPDDDPALSPAIPAKDPAPEVSSDGLPVGPQIDRDLLKLLHAGGPAAFTATMHEWTDVSALASQTPAAARRAGFGGLGYLIDAVSEGPGAVQRTSTVRIFGPLHYQIDRSCQPRHGPVTIACDGEYLRKVYSDKITIGPAEPLPRDVGQLADPSWLLQCWLAGGVPVMADGRSAYRMNVTRRRDYPSHLLLFPTALAVVDAELGCIVRLTSYVGGKAVQRHELENLMPATGKFQVDVPAGLPVTEAGPFDDVSRPAHFPGPPVTLGRIIARQAATGAAKAAKNLLDRLGPRDRV